MSIFPPDDSDDVALNEALIRIQAEVPVPSNYPPMTPARAAEERDYRAGRVPIVSEAALSPFLTPEQRAEDIAEMKAQLLGDLLAVLRRR